MLLVNFSIFDPWLPRLVELPSKKILYFHNITPPRFLQVYDAEYAAHCADGIAQLKLPRPLRRADGQLDQLGPACCRNWPRRRQEARPSRIRARDGPFDEASRLLEKVVVELESHAEQPLDVTTSPPIIGRQGLGRRRGRADRLAAASARCCCTSGASRRTSASRTCSRCSSATER